MASLLVNANLWYHICPWLLPPPNYPVLARAPPGKNVTVLTHCNTGALATAGYGTALGVIRSLHARGRLAHVYCTETRPYNQGSRLTAFELVYEGIPATLVTDSMVAALMKHRTMTVTRHRTRMTRMNQTTPTKSPMRCSPFSLGMARMWTSDRDRECESESNSNRNLVAM